MNARAACRYMKMITPAKLLHTLRTGEGAIDVDPQVAARARARRRGDGRHRGARPRRGMSQEPDC